MVRCPVTVGVVTLAPWECRLEPREVKVTSEPGVVAMLYRSASQARRETSEERDADVGRAVL